MIQIKEIFNAAIKAGIVGQVLQDLPEWFGIPESTQNYIDEARGLRTWAAYSDEQPIAFLTLQETSPVSVEIHCMGVKKAFHRQGVGSALFQIVLEEIRGHYQILQVKTVAKGHYKEYDQTNAFYEKMGFLDLEIFPEMWDPWNPCLIKLRMI